MVLQKNNLFQNNQKRQMIALHCSKR